MLRKIIINSFPSADCHGFFGSLGLCNQLPRLSLTSLPLPQSWPHHFHSWSGSFADRCIFLGSVPWKQFPCRAPLKGSNAARCQTKSLLLCRSSGMTTQAGKRLPLSASTRTVWEITSASKLTALLSLMKWIFCWPLHLLGFSSLEAIPLQSSFKRLKCS